MQKKLSSKELVAAGHQFAKNLSSNTPLIDMAKMVSQLATQLDLALVAAGEACKQRDAVLAENVMLKGFIDEECYTLGEAWSSNGQITDAAQSVPETPATDALLNVVRAEGVDMFADVSDAVAEEKYGDDWRSSEFIRYSASQARLYASQLRAETDTTSSQCESLAGGK